MRPENALDALLDELQTFAKPTERSVCNGEAGAGVGGRGTDGVLRRLASYPSGSDTDVSPPVRARGQQPAKPPVPERHPELLALAVAGRRAPPPPPPRTSSRSPLASPVSPASPASPAPRLSPPDADSSRHSLLEQRHQELLKKQRALQEQYTRLQMIQRSGSALPPNAQPDLKKTGSESNLLTKMNLNLAITGSMSHLCINNDGYSTRASNGDDNQPVKDTEISINKIYETDIL